jgi:hypothetical protein
MATYHIRYVFMSFKAVPFESRMFPNIFSKFKVRFVTVSKLSI